MGSNDQEAQLQLIRDQEIIRDLKQQRDQVDLTVIYYKNQTEEYQKTQMIFNQTQHHKEEKYLNDIIQLQAKKKDLENVVCKMGKSTETLRLLTNEQKAFRDNLRKSGLGYNGPYVLSQAYVKIPKLYRAYELCDQNEKLHVFDSEDTLEDAEHSRLKMNEFHKDEKFQATAKFEAYFEKLKNKKVVLERQLARKVDDSKAEKDQFLEEVNHLRTQLENMKGKSVETKFDKSSILGKPPAKKLLITSQLSNLWFTPNIVVQKDLSKPITAQSLPKTEKDHLLKKIASLESKLASQNIRSCQKAYHELRTSYNALKVKFDSLNRKRRETNVSKKVHTGESLKPFSRRVSQFTTYSLQKDRKFSKNSQKGFITRTLNAKNHSFEASHSCFTSVKQVWRSIKESQTFEASTSQKRFKTRTLKGKNQVFVTLHSHFTPVKQVWRPKQSHLKTFKYFKSEMLSIQNKNDLALENKNNKRSSKVSKMTFQNDTSNGNNKWKFSSPTRFKTPHKTPSFNNQWKIKRDFKSPLIPRELFSNETPISSPR
nr:outer membrane protein porin [Tanacetum cinerariifolium]